MSKTTETRPRRTLADVVANPPEGWTAETNRACDCLAHFAWRQQNGQARVATVRLEPGRVAMTERVRESGKRVQPLTPEQQREHEQMVRVLMEEREKLRASEAARPTATKALVSAARDQLRERLERAGVETAFDMIWRSR